MAGEADEVRVYWRPGCPFCYALRLGLRLRRLPLPLRETNIWEDASAAGRVREITGGDETVPTVVVGSTTMVNPRPGAVVAAARSAC
ncbi:glutaredoxin [Haloactinospora alba]|uniref:Glutaredoxin n=1 Tax=Haloactinospora alba TaxID=405555 RepID=A0A543NN45_9ACTN|nr:glutaredoxin domain-containing protein [Haloactinospora alba]TQN33248.1 glutaredoxin [Haloactinospora alba]